MTMGYESGSPVKLKTLEERGCDEAWAALAQIASEKKRATDMFRKMMESPVDSQELVG